MYFALPADHKAKDKRKRKDKQILGPCQRDEKTVEHEGDGDTNCSRRTGNSS